MTRQIMRVPAKINLTLEITGRRADGYHLLDSVMQAVSLCDTVAVTLTGREGISLAVTGAPLAADGDNTVCRAAEAFFAATGRSNPGLAIALEKHIPLQAGLAGGSADAAGVLLALDRLCATGLTVAALQEIGLKVGADVPFCLQGGCARATGIGEQLVPLPVLPECAVVIAKPVSGVSTAGAYAAADTLPFGDGAASDAVAAALAQGDLGGVGMQLQNVFQQALQLPETERLCELARKHGALGAQMTGSGSAMFALFARPSLAATCLTALERAGATACICRPMKGGPCFV